MMNSQQRSKLPEWMRGYYAMTTKPGLEYR